MTSGGSIQRPDPLRAPNGRRIRLGSGIAWGLAAQAVALVSTLAIGIVVARALGPSGKGVLSLVQQSVGLLVVLGDLGIAVAAIYYVSRGEIPAGTMLGTVLRVLAAVSAVALPILVVLLRSPVAVTFSPWTYVGAAMALFVSSLGLSWVSAVLTGLEGVRGGARASIVASLGTLVLVVAAWASGRLTPLAVLLASAAAAAIGIGAGLAPSLAFVRPVRYDGGVVRRMARFSLRLYAATAADLVHFRQELLLLGWMRTPAEVGLYSVALGLAELISRLPAAIGSAIQAQASRVDSGSALEFSSRAIRLTALTAIALVGGGAALAHVAIRALYGAAFVPAVAAFYVLVPRMLANSMVWPISSFQSAQKIVYWRASVAAALANLVLNVVLVPRFGFLGAALSASISHTLLFGVLLQRLCRDTRQPVSAFLVPTSEDVATLRRAVLGYLKGEPS